MTVANWNYNMENKNEFRTVFNYTRPRGPKRVWRLHYATRSHYYSSGDPEKTFIAGQGIAQKLSDWEASRRHHERNRRNK